MKVEVIEKKKEEPVLRVKLIKDNEGNVQMVACDEKGNQLFCSNLITLNQDGTIYLHAGICFRNADKLLQLDHQHRIKIKHN